VASTFNRRDDDETAGGGSENRSLDVRSTMIVTIRQRIEKADVGSVIATNY